MKKDSIRADHPRQAAVLAGVLIAGAALAVNPGGPGPAYAAERLVLCEEFTNKW